MAIVKTITQSNRISLPAAGEDVPRARRPGEQDKSDQYSSPKRQPAKGELFGVCGELLFLKLPFLALLLLVHCPRSLDRFLRNPLPPERLTTRRLGDQWALVLLDMLVNAAAAVDAGNECLPLTPVPSASVGLVITVCASRSTRRKVFSL